MVHDVFQNADEKLVSEYRLAILPSSKTVFVEAVIRSARTSKAGRRALDPASDTFCYRVIKCSKSYLQIDARICYKIPAIDHLFCLLLAAKSLFDWVSITWHVR